MLRAEIPLLKHVPVTLCHVYILFCRIDIIGMILVFPIESEAAVLESLPAG